MDEANADRTRPEDVSRLPESRRELLRALFDRPDAAIAPPVFGHSEWTRLFAAAPAARAGEPPAGGGIDPEMIAAFVEGVLDQEERARVLEILANDDRAFDQLLTVARFRLGRQSAAAASRQVERSPRGLLTTNRWLLPIAAALAVLAIWSVVDQRARSLPSGAELVAQAEGPAAGFVPFEQERPKLRSPTPVVEPRPKPALFELGMRTVDLAWLVRRAGSEEAMHIWVGRISYLLKIAGLPPARSYESLIAAAHSDPFTPTPREFALAEAELTSMVPREPPLYEFGRWSEAARLAAWSRSESFFRNPEFYRRPLERFRRAEPDPTVQRLLQALPDSELNALQLDAIVASLEEIQAHCLAGGECLGGRHTSD